MVKNNLDVEYIKLIQTLCALIIINQLKQQSTIIQLKDLSFKGILN